MIYFSWVKGAVSDVFINAEDSEWSLNIKPVILSSFVLQLDREVMTHSLSGISKDKTLLQSKLRIGDYLPTFTLMEVCFLFVSHTLVLSIITIVTRT